MRNLHLLPLTSGLLQSPVGVNNYVNDGAGRFSTTGKPALFLLDLSKPTSDNWTPIPPTISKSHSP